MPLTALQKRDTARWTKSDADARAVSHGCWFDLAAGKHVVTFFETFLRHSKGEWAGQPFTLLKWQSEGVIKPLFGWKRADGTRRYRMGYIEVPKKQGKSTLASGIALYGLMADDEPGAEVYSAASSREQASIVFREADTMQRSSPTLSKHILSTPSTRHMACKKTNSFYKALAAEAGPVEGLNISHLVMDEMHIQRDDRLWHALMYGGAARRQPLKIIITTAGVDQDSLCYEYHTKALAILRGAEFDDSFFAYVKSAEWAMERVPKEDRDSVWHDEAVWFEANPSLGHTITLESFREDYQAAVQSPRLENAFKRYRLNIWTEQDERWLPMDHWAQCGDAVSPTDLLGLSCYAGLDLATVSDLCALVLLFPTAGNAVLPFFWLPRDTARERLEHGDSSYIDWARQGYLTLTEGNVTDYGAIRQTISGAIERDGRIMKEPGALMERYDVRMLAIDPYNATHLTTQLMGDGVPVERFRNGILTMSAPSKELERLVSSHGLRHGQHPVLTWNAQNVTVTRDTKENIMPKKPTNARKIDGITALVMALGLSIATPLETGTVYDERMADIY
jgi:phage terminase large subunit-like protein